MHNQVNPLVIPVELFERFKGQEDAYMLLSFYYSHRNKDTKSGRKTNRIWCVSAFVEKGLGWGHNRVQDARKTLRHMGLIKEVKGRFKDGKLGKNYVQLNTIQPTLTDEQLLQNCSFEQNSYNFATHPDLPPVVKQETSATTEETRSAFKIKDKGEVDTIFKTKDEEVVANHDLPKITKTEEKEKAEKTEKEKAEKEEVVTEDEYVKEIKPVFEAMAGEYGGSLLRADLDSNLHRTNYKGQLDYWLTRFTKTPDGSKIWRLVGMYAELYYDTNGSMPDMRQFLKGWYAKNWKDQDANIRAQLKKQQELSPEYDEYIKARAKEGRLIPAKYLFTAGDFMRWFNNQD